MTACDAAAAARSTSDQMDHLIGEKLIDSKVLEQLTCVRSDAGCSRGRGWAMLCMVASAACWGAATALTKGALAELPPLSLLTAQLAASSVFLWTITLAGRQPLTLNSDARLAALAGILEPGLAYAFGIAGLVLTSASSASLIGTTEPLLVVALAFLLFGVRTGWRQLAAIVVAMAGIALVGGSDAQSSGGSLFGNALVVLATVFAALYVVTTSRLSASAAPVLLAALQQTVGFLFAALLMAAALVTGFERIDALPGLEGCLLIAASGIVQYGLAFWFYLTALRHIEVGTAALFLALIPVFGIAAAMAFLGEPLALGQTLGCALIVAAIAAAARGRRSPVGAPA
jgi:drug/metabolite transporter (DMT)-like permease